MAAAPPPPQATIVNVTALARMTMMMLEVEMAILYGEMAMVGGDLILRNISLETRLDKEVGENILRVDSKKTIISAQPLRNR